MKVFIVVMVAWVALMIGLSLYDAYPIHTYEVTITFCDGRKPLTTLVERGAPINNSAIDTYKEAVPKFRLNGKSYLNVCDVTSVKIK
jgi:hypothetical protein